MAPIRFSATMQIPSTKRNLEGVEPKKLERVSLSHGKVLENPDVIEVAPPANIV